MQKKSLIQQNPHLKNNKSYLAALRVNVLSSMAVEGVRTSAERAIKPTVVRAAKA